MDLNSILDKLLGSSESELVEFKEAKNNYDFKKLGQYFSALSNEANLKGADNSWLLFGVDDNKNVVGTNYRNNASRLDALKGELARDITEGICFREIHEIQKDGKRVLAFEIPPAPKGIPVAFKGHYYARNGESLTHLNINKLDIIRSQSNESDWSKCICNDATLDDLDPLAITVAREQFLKKNPKHSNEMEQWDDKTFLNKAKLTIRNKITRAAILLLGKPESAHFLNPAQSTITWILKDKDGIDKDYEHFSCPFILSVEDVYKKIRNLKYRYIAKDSLFPEEVDQFAPYIIREALNNAIAHQDYALGGKITVVEFENGKLMFSNMGRFIPESVERVVTADSPESRYRNPFLAEAMVNLNLIDTIGSGIRKMFMIQKSRYFPLPEYDIDTQKVSVTITGHVLDINYALKLVQMPELTLDDIMLLDRVQKQKPLSKQQAAHLKKANLIEGRRPNLFISKNVAETSGEKTQYIKNKGFDDQFYKKMIIEYLTKFGIGVRADFDDLLAGKLPEVLDETQKKDKIKNLLQRMKKEGLIEVKGKKWRKV